MMRTMAPLLVLVFLWGGPVWAAQTPQEHMDGQPHADMAAPAAPPEAGQGMADMQHGDHAAMPAPQTEGMEGMAEGHDHAAMQKKAGTEVGVDEKLGGHVADVVLKDAAGHDVNLRELVSRGPTLILPVYYSCPNVCNLLQSSFVRILPKVDLVPGKELQIVSLSFDENDTPEVAAKNKHNFAFAVKKHFPPEYWTFLTGDKAAIDAAMDSIGFRFKRMGEDFAHPVVVVAVAPDGKVVRYLYGLDFLPFDVTMAATEAAQGKIGMSVKRLLATCFSYDPKGRRYVFDLMRVSGVAIIAFIVLLLTVLLFAGKKKRR